MVHFSAYLRGQKFILFIDHNPLKKLNKSTPTHYAGFISTWGLTTSKSDIKRKKKCLLIF
jgi:hypothetical protein